MGKASRRKQSKKTISLAPWTPLPPIAQVTGKTPEKSSRLEAWEKVVAMVASMAKNKKYINPLAPDTSGKRLTVFVSVDADIGGCADLGEYWEYDIVQAAYKYHGELITADGHVYRWYKRVDTESAGNPVHIKMLRQEALAAIFQTARKEGRV